MRDKKHLVHHSNKLAEKAKEKALFRTQRKPVEAGAHGTLSYKIKKGINKNKIADEKIIKSKLCNYLILNFVTYFRRIFM